MEIPSVKGATLKALIKGKQSSSLPRQKTIHAGWLWKKGALNTQLVNKRWFVIKGDQLYYFKTDEETAPLGQVPLAGNEVKRHPIPTDGTSKFVFELVAGKEREGRPITENFESLLFAAATLNEMEKWIKAINRVIYTPYGGGMFGRSLKETLQIESHRGGGMVPIIVEICVDYIRKHGLKEEGIFRIPGSKDEVEALKQAFNTGSVKSLEEDLYKVSIVASVFKQYLGDLPEPVIPSENFGQFIAVGAIYKENEENAVKKFEDLLNDIPKAHFDLLKFICRFLFELQTYHEYTKMTADNLALVFGPNILHSPGADPSDLLRCLSEANATVIALILHHEQLFPVTDDDRYYDPNYSPYKSDSTFGEWTNSKLMGFESLSKNASLLPEPLSEDRRSLSESNLVDLVETNNESSSSSKRNPESEKDERISDLERKLDTCMKVQEMLKMRLKEEVESRKSAEKRIELYRRSIEDYCRKFGHMDINIA